MAHPSDNVEQSAAEREPPLVTGVREVASPVSDRYLRSWYLQRVTELSACGQTSSGEADWEIGMRRRSNFRIGSQEPGCDRFVDGGEGYTVTVVPSNLVIVNSLKASPG